MHLTQKAATTYPFHDSIITVTHCGRICFKGLRLRIKRDWFERGYRAFETVFPGLLESESQRTPGHSSKAASIWRLAELRTSRRAKRLLLAGTRCQGAFSLFVSASISPTAIS